MKKVIGTLLLSLMALGVGIMPIQDASARTESFRETCWDWQWRSNGDLCSYCRKRDGRTQYSCLPNANACTSDIANRNGWLVCG